MFKLLDGHERHWRSLAKAVSWRATGTLDTFIISYIVSGKVSIASTIAGIEVFTKIMLFYFHERIWAVIPWGRSAIAGSVRGAVPKAAAAPDFAQRA